jgi:pimeloyl-ACP methyl ester carboxylesterase
MSAPLLIDTGLELPGEGALRVAADVRLPAQVGASPLVLVCLPGGGMNRRYWDLHPPAEAGADDGSFSFAEQMTRRGFVVVALDHLGVGDSSRPEDGHLLSAELVTQANTAATAKLLAGLRDGSLLPGVAAMPGLHSIGVGHSMGAMFTILQQAAASQHIGVALLGFSTRGLPEYVTPEVRELSKDVAAVRARVPEFARRMFPKPYLRVQSSRGSGGGGDNSLFAGNKAEPLGVAALKDAVDGLLPQPAYLSMIPGNVAPEAAQITVPVFLGIGELDMAGPTHQIPAGFPGSQDVTLVILPQAGHSHFLFPARAALYERLDVWARSVPKT